MDIGDSAGLRTGASGGIGRGPLHHWAHPGKA